MKTTLEHLATIGARRRFRIIALVTLLAYAVLYLYGLGYLVAAPGAGESIVALNLVPDWTTLMFRQRSAYLFEPVGTLQVGPLVLFLSPPNLALALVLGTLVAANVAVSAYAFQTIGFSGARSAPTLFATLPALLSGAACCAPTAIVALGLQFTATLATFWSLLVPASAVLLVVSLAWSLHGLARPRACAAAPHPAQTPSRP